MAALAAFRDPDKMTKSSKRRPARSPSSASLRPGRPKTTLCARTRAAVWAAGVEWQAKKSLSAVERDYIRDSAPHRVGFAQPKAWTKYVRGARTPTPPGKKGSEVAWAERVYPGTIGPYHSALWTLLDLHRAGECIDTAWSSLVDEIDPKVLREIDVENWTSSGYLLPRLGAAGFYAALEVPHLDAFAILLFPVCRSPIYEPPTKPLVYAARWLQRWSRAVPALRRTRDLLFELLSSYVTEFSFLNSPPQYVGLVDDVMEAINRMLYRGLHRLVNIDDNGLADRMASGLLDDTFFGGAVGDEHDDDGNLHLPTASESQGCESYFVADDESGSVFEIPARLFGKGVSLTDVF